MTESGKKDAQQSNTKSSSQILDEIFKQLEEKSAKGQVFSTSDLTTAFTTTNSAPRPTSDPHDNSNKTSPGRHKHRHKHKHKKSKKHGHRSRSRRSSSRSADDRKSRNRRTGNNLTTAVAAVHAKSDVPADDNAVAEKEDGYLTGKRAANDNDVKSRSLQDGAQDRTAGNGSIVAMDTEKLVGDQSNDADGQYDNQECASERSKDEQDTLAETESVREGLEQVEDEDENNVAGGEDVEDDGENVEAEGENVEVDEENVEDENVEMDEENVEGENIEVDEENEDENVEADEENVEAEGDNVEADEENVEVDEQNVEVDEENVEVDEENVEADRESVEADEEPLETDEDKEESVEADEENVETDGGIEEADEGSVETDGESVEGEADSVEADADHVEGDAENSDNEGLEDGELASDQAEDDVVGSGEENSNTEEMAAQENEAQDGDASSHVDPDAENIGTDEEKQVPDVNPEDAGAKEDVGKTIADGLLSAERKDVDESKNAVAESSKKSSAKGTKTKSKKKSKRGSKKKSLKSKVTVVDNVSKRTSHKRKSSSSKGPESSKRRKLKDKKSRPSKSKKSRSRSPRKNSKNREETRRDLRRRSLSRSRTRRSRSRSPTPRKTSRDSYRHSARSRSKGRSKSRSPRMEKIDKVKLLQIARKNALAMMAAGQLPVNFNVQKLKEEVVVPIKAGGKSVAELTNFCKILSKKEMEEGECSNYDSEHSHSGDDEEEGKEKREKEAAPFVHHPFKLKEQPTSIIVNIRNAIQIPTKTPAEKVAEGAKLRIQFPVSSGTQHRQKESEWVPVSPKKDADEAKSCDPKSPPKAKPIMTVAKIEEKVFAEIAPPPTPVLDIGAIVSQRLKAVRQLMDNPENVEAQGQMYRSQQQMQYWAQSKQLPGQFTGSTDAQILTPQQLAGPSCQAWVRKDQFASAAPVQSGFGLHILQKMGWKPGEGLGKNKEGTALPLLLDIKLDKKGLVTAGEVPRGCRKPPPPAVKDLSGKHPVSALGELCNKRRWPPPEYNLIQDSGPDHKKNFLFKVRVHNVEYQPTDPSPNKKHAKAQSAMVCLQSLGMFPRNAAVPT